MTMNNNKMKYLTFTLEETVEEDQYHKRLGTLNRGPVMEMWLDTGCSRTTVRKDLVPPSALKPGRRLARVANGELLSCGLADVELANSTMWRQQSQRDRQFQCCWAEIYHGSS